ncbi:MAG: hypothetical protein ACE5J3_12715 [Methanosarcinales archaeon]
MDIFYWLCEKGVKFLKYSENNGNNVTVGKFKDYLLSKYNKILKRELDASYIYPIQWALNFYNITKIISSNSDVFLSDKDIIKLTNDIDEKFIRQTRSPSSYRDQFFKKLKTGRYW